MAVPNIHLLLDLTQSSADADSIRQHVSTLMSSDALGSFVSNALVLTAAPLRGMTPADNWTFVATAAPLPEANAAMEYAGDCRAHLLILLEPVIVNSEAVSMLANAFQLDPHFGVSVPRQCDPATAELLKLAADAGDPALAILPRRVLSVIPDYYLLPEILSPCMLVRDTLVANLPLLDSSYDTLAGALQQYLARCRRAGFRTVMLNRTTVTAAVERNGTSPFVSKSDNRKLHMQYPDVGKAKTEFAEHSLHLHESLLGRAFSACNDLRKTLLLDIRGVPNHMNGTAEAIFGLCDGLKAIETDWRITLLAEPASIEYHHLEKRYALWPFVTSLDKHFFTAAFRPSQPWHISTMIELHNTALLNFYAVLDTISWDILFEAPRGLGAYWDFLSQYADGLFYISNYTREHFARRFPSAETRPGHVFHLPPDGVDSLLKETGSGDYIFVIGNSYDHKNLAPTVDLLSAAFPFQPFKVLGLKSHANPRVEVLESGRIAQTEIDQLFAQARLIVFPSLYEGFGLPTLKSLSYGRTVMARESELLREIAGEYRGPGTLHSYSTPQELVESIGKVLHGVPLANVPLGTALSNNQQPKTWPEVARGVVAFIEGQTSDPAGFQWTQRERVTRLLNACSF